MYAPQVIVEVLKNGKKQMKLIKNREKLSMHPNITAVTVHPTYLKKITSSFSSLYARKVSLERSLNGLCNSHVFYCSYIVQSIYYCKLHWKRLFMLQELVM